MARKARRLLFPASIAAVAASQWREITRYLKITQMSRGGEQPQAASAKGKHAHRKRRGGRASDGDFDSASRGGPADSA